MYSKVPKQELCISDVEHWGSVTRSKQQTNSTSVLAYLHTLLQLFCAITSAKLTLTTIHCSLTTKSNYHQIANDKLSNIKQYKQSFNKGQLIATSFDDRYGGFSAQ